jgi:hypothetical protein
MFLRKNARFALGAAGGLIAGYLYWRFVGCSSGTCPISSNPYVSMFWFALIGLLLVPSKKNSKKAES